MHEQRLIGDPRHGKGHEREVLEEFFRRLALPPPQLEDSECPDFVVEFGNKPTVRLGCEITMFFSDAASRGSLGMRAISEWRRFSASFTEELRNKKIPITGTLHFLSTRNDNEGDAYIKGSAHRHLLSFVADKRAISELRSLLDGWRQELPERITVASDSFPSLSNFVAAVSLVVDEGNANHWWASHLRTGELIDPLPSLNKIIRKKAKRSLKYRNNIDELWLVIYADGLQLESICVLDSVTDGAALEQAGRFDRIWVWDGFLEQVWQIFPVWDLVSDSATKTIQMKKYPSLLRPYCTAGVASI